MPVHVTDAVLPASDEDRAITQAGSNLSPLNSNENPSSIWHQRYIHARSNLSAVSRVSLFIHLVDRDGIEYLIEIISSCIRNLDS